MRQTFESYHQYRGLVDELGSRLTAEINAREW